MDMSNVRATFRALFGRERALLDRPTLPATWTIPVLLIHYFPVRDGRIDRAVTGDVDAPLDSIREHCARTTERVIEALERGSIYHGYKDPTAAPSLRYELAGSLEVLEPLPVWPKPGHTVPMTDYNAILERAGIRDWVEREGVREVWLWAYHGGVVDMWESNMAGPFGDVSNSDCDPTDLPALNSTYTVYHYNYQRGASEAVEDHMHQIERLLDHADHAMFWDRFVGKTGEGRCGWAHFPPNGERDYDWANRKRVWTDIEDWKPDGSGEKQLLNCERWDGDSLKWFIYWMQNLPGAGNSLVYRGRPLPNWWRFIGGWDGAMAARAGLVE